MRKYHVYIASCTLNGGIYHYVLQDGTFYFCEKISCDRPMYMNLHQNQMQVLLRAPFSEEQESGLCVFERQESGELTVPVAAEMTKEVCGSVQGGDVVSTRGIVACHLCQWKGEIYAANYLSGSVFGTNGALAIHEGKGPHRQRQEAPHVHFVAPAPDSACLFAVDLGTDTIYSYDEMLQLLSTAHVPSGHGARHLAYSEDGKTVFCVGELASTVTVFTYDKGTLIPIETVSVLDHESDSIAAAIRVKGNWVYVSNRGDDSISSLCWDGKHLTLQHVTSCGGVFPRDFLIIEDLLICTNEKSDNVTLFRVDGGRLTDTGITLNIPAPLCVVASP